MNLADESLLSAYLDDELDASRRAEVEAALRSDPLLSERLGDLTMARDLVAGLGRPAAPPESSAAILARLAGRRPGRGGSGRPGPFAMGAFLGLAALVVAALTLTLQVRPVPGPRPTVASPAPALPGPEVASGPAAPPATPAPGPSGGSDELAFHGGEGRGGGEGHRMPGRSPEKKGAIRGLDESPREASAVGRGMEKAEAVAPIVTEARVGVQAPPAAPAEVASANGPKGGTSLGDARSRILAEAPAAPELAKQQAEPFQFAEKAKVAAADRDEIRALLARPGVRRFTITVDVMGPQELDRVDEVVKTATKKGPRWGRVAVEQGVAIDPERPGEAVVYALVLDGPEQDRLRKALEDRFPEVREDRPTEGIVDQLSRTAGQVALYHNEPSPGLPAPNQAQPRDRPMLASRTSEATNRQDAAADSTGSINAELGANRRAGGYPASDKKGLGRDAVASNYGLKDAPNNVDPSNMTVAPVPAPGASPASVADAASYSMQRSGPPVAQAPTPEANDLSHSSNLRGLKRNALQDGASRGREAPGDKVAVQANGALAPDPSPVLVWITTRSAAFSKARK